MELVDQLRLAIPQELRSAEEVISQKDQIINQAQSDARRTKSKAEEDYRDRLDHSDLVAMAEHRAEETLKDAEQKAGQILLRSEDEARNKRTDADAYALRSLRNLEKELSSLSGSVRKGIEVLAGQAVAGLNGRYSADGFPED
ncbi:MAG: hypothetical protein BZY75_02875 [SAR202 cluster bacterium Io17-Chloro-G7]|nr:MAG: hypothetical protein BZY75_02875 [SAR202 cluster bacterium Io17-Chloro-G7]